MPVQEFIIERRKWILLLWAIESKKITADYKRETHTN